MPVRHHIRSLTLLAIAGLAHAAETVPYLIPSAGSPMTTTVIKSVGETGATGVKMAGLPDGLGAYDNGDGTFTLLMNQELGTTAGIVRAHGSKGGWVSRWVINKTTLAVDSITDFNPNATSIHLWNRTTGVHLAGGTTAYGRPCSADLPPVSAFYNAATGKGTQNRIFMNGEENGNEGRSFAHVATGPDAGKSWELPHLGQASWENQLACPYAQDATIVIGLDDTTPGQVYVYVGAKNTTGVTDVEKAGLVGGTLYGIRASNVLKEDRAMNIAIAAKGGSATFSLISLGNVSGLLGATVGTTGAKLQADSVAAGVTEFLRPEDGCWDPNQPSDFYFVTTDRFDNLKNGGNTTGSNVGRSRLWKLHFSDLTNPTAGGSIAMLLDGTEAHQMLDNITVDQNGRILLQEDTGSNEFAARIWSYQIGTGTLTQVLTHNPTLFGDRVAPLTTLPASGFTNDEESSGVIPVFDILGAGKFLAVTQAHGTTKYSDGSSIPDLAETVEGGQLMVLTYAVPANVAPTAGAVTSTTVQATALTIPTSTVLATVTDPENDAVAVTAATITSGDTTGIVKVVGDKIIYTPSAGFAGTTTITYTVRDGVRLSQGIPRTAMMVASNGVTNTTVWNSGLGSDIYPVAGTSDQFWTIADRGPNADSSLATPPFTKLFPNPFYAPTLAKVRWNADNTITVLSTVTLKDESNAPLTGIPNAIDAGVGQTTGHMEIAKSMIGNMPGVDIPGAPKGIDSESVTIDASGNFWVSDEYGPWITKFSPTGQTLERVGPYAANGSGHKLPKVFAKRTPGRGMESMTLSTDGTKLIGLMQSGLMTGGITTESNGKKVAAVRILVYTIASGACEEYAYVLDTESGTKRLVACSIYPDANGTDYYVLERDGDAGVTAGIKKVYKFAFGAATNINDSMGDSADGTLFGMGSQSMETISSASGTTANAISNLTGASITPVTKTLVKDLTPLCDAYPHDKWEGLTVRSDGKLIIANDDDFGITGTDSLGPKTLLNTSTVDFNQFMEVDPTKMLTATGTITVTVTVTNTAPTITNALDLSTLEDTATPAIGITVGDNETAAAALTVTATSSNTTLIPAINVVLGGSGTGRTLVATPTANQNGTSTITVTVSDGTLSASDTFVLTVTAVNDAPVAVAGIATVVAGASVNASVTATDADAGASLTYSKVADPTKGMVTVNPNGTFIYTANPGTTGIDTFTFKANDTFADSNVATVTVTITAAGGSGGSSDSSSSSSGCGLGGGVGALVLAFFVGLKGLFLRRRS